MAFPERVGRSLGKIPPAGKAAAHPRVVLIFECIIACGVLAASAVVRIWCVRNLPMQPESDDKTYYEIANLLKEGTLLTDGPGYCDYVAMFPHVLGYPYALSIVFRLFGTSVLTAQYFNVALAVGAVFLTYRIARRLGGRISFLPLHNIDYLRLKQFTPV